jgi:hypothetical protein
MHKTQGGQVKEQSLRGCAVKWEQVRSFLVGGADLVVGICCPCR